MAAEESSMSQQDKSKTRKARWERPRITDTMSFETLALACSKAPGAPPFGDPGVCSGNGQPNPSLS